MSCEPPSRPAFLNRAVEEHALREMWAQFEDHYRQRNATGVANLFAPDGDRINHQGQLAQGRSEVQQQYEAIFRNESDPVSQSRDATLTIRFLRPDVALLDGRWTSNGASGIIKGVFTVIAMKEHNRWWIVAGRDRGALSAHLPPMMSEP